MSVAPRLWYQVVFQDGVGNKLSNVSPYNECTITFSSNVHIQKFYCRATVVGDEWGYDIGTLVAEYNNRDANTQISFTLNANNHLLEGENSYRIGLYLQDDNGIWNLDEAFVVTNNGGSQFVVDDNYKFIVGQSAPIYPMSITINAGTTIDLSLLKGLSSNKIVWGDGTTTHIGFTHTYSASGTYIIQANFPDVKYIESYFLNDNTAITSIDLTNLKNVTNINDYFMKGCTSLTSITTVNFTKVTKIGNDFLYGCSALTAFNLQNFTSITNIGNNFLYNCSSIISLTTTYLTNCSIGTSFLSGCSGLTSIDISTLQAITTIPNNFLYGCSGLTSLSFTNLTNITTIGNNFLSGCSGLTSLNLAINTNITSINSNFLNGCSSLTTLYVPVVSSYVKIPTLVSWGTLSALTKIVCGAMVAYYSYTNVWKEKSNIMVNTL